MKQTLTEVWGLPFARDALSDRLHAIMGRALFVAARFEDHVTELAVALGARDGGAANDGDSVWSDSEWRVLIEQVVKRQLYGNIQKIIGPQDSYSSRYWFHRLDGARRARNSIVHDLPHEMARALESELSGVQLIQAIRFAVEEITSVDWAVLQSLQVVHELPRLDVDLYWPYCKVVVEWVCSPAPYKAT